MATKHTVKSYDADLGLHKSKISEIGREVEDQIANANQALLERDCELAELVRVSDEKVNVLQQESEELGVRILATRQPMAKDLRNVIAGLKMASELDHHLNLDQPIDAITEMVKLAKKMLTDLTNAYATGDLEKAIAVWHRDDQIDAVYADLSRELRIKMSEDADNIKA